ncbi:hypothetical protein [Aequorivita marina]|uniref:hypothetical protein n=1 Tax=Aequorivita marina TaxID=3073654 RepID=UPI00287407F0|nr:hypothetical protein [Aequorivita sp. S2608]MDS1299621.1 hypothetical protein [Aequorivita sp. S2608]
METLKNKTTQRCIFFSALVFFIVSLSSITAKELVEKPTKVIIGMENQVTIKITKKTSLEELEQIKRQMEDDGFEFNYSNVVYNDSKEIISISISYKDANNNAGNYSVSSQNPINNILIISNGSQISVKSVGGGNQSTIIQSNGRGNQSSISQSTSSKNYNDHQKHIAERKAEMEKRRVEMDKRMAARRQEMKERGSKMRARMENERNSMFEERQIKNSQSFSGNYHLITKNTTKADLLKLKEVYKSENISFSYDQLERNSDDLITYISITINNGQGSISTSSFGNGKDPIKDVSIGVDSEHTIMKSTE